MENLVIDETCSFAGSSAGALSVVVTGEVKLISIKNRGSVSGVENVGGFVGHVKGLKQEVVLIDHCRNREDINGSNYIGGFVGTISGNEGVNVTIVDSFNDADVHGSQNGVGGLVGCVDENVRVNFQHRQFWEC